MYYFDLTVPCIFVQEFTVCPVKMTWKLSTR